MQYAHCRSLTLTADRARQFQPQQATMRDLIIAFLLVFYVTLELQLQARATWDRSRLFMLVLAYFFYTFLYHIVPQLSPKFISVRIARFLYRVDCTRNRFNECFRANFNTN